MAQWKVRCQRCGPRQMRQACLLLKVHHWVGCCFSVPCLWAAFEGVRSGFEFFVHGRIAVFVERPRHVLSSWALREVWLCKKRAVVTSLLKAMLLEVGAGALGMCPF